MIIEEPSPPDETDNLYEINVLGFTTQPNGIVIPDAVVELEGESTFSDLTGLFHLDKKLVGNKGKVIKYTAEEYLPSYHRLYNYGSLESVIVDLSMIHEKNKVTIGPDGGAITEQYVSVNIDQGVLMNDSEMTFQFLYGEYSNNGNSDPLFLENGVEFLMKEVSLYIMGTSLINTSENINVEIDTEILKSQNVDDLSVFFYDEVDLSWKEKDISLEQIGDKISFSIDTYGWWTIAQKIPAQKGAIKLMEEDNIAVKNSEVLLSFGAGYINRLKYYTDANGRISGYFPQNTTITLVLNNAKFRETLDDGFSEVDLEKEVVLLDDVQFEFSGRVYTCEFDESNGFVAIISQGQHKIESINNGSFDSESFEEDENVTLHFYSETFDYLSTEEVANQSFKEDKGFISCNDLSDNMTVSDGSNLMLDFDMCRVKVRPKETVVIGEKIGADAFLVSFEGREEGIWDGLFYFPPLLDDVKSEVTVNVILFDEEENKVGGYIETEYISSGEELVISFIGNID